MKKRKTKTDRLKEQAKKRLSEKKREAFEKNASKKKGKGKDEPTFSFLINGLLALAGLVLLFIAGPMNNNIFLLVLGSVLVMIPTMNYSNYIAKKRVEKKKQAQNLEPVK